MTYLDAGMDRMGDSDLRLSSHYTVTTIIFFLHMLLSLRNAIKKWLHDKRLPVELESALLDTRSQKDSNVNITLRLSYIIKQPLKITKYLITLVLPSRG